MRDGRSHGLGWSERFAEAAGPYADVILALRLCDEPQRGEFIAAYRDEMSRDASGDPVGVLLLHWLLDLMPSGAAPTTAIDERVWWALCEKRDVLGLLSPQGSLTSALATTETELRVMHAAWNSAIAGGSARLTSRCLDAARLYLENVRRESAAGGNPTSINLTGIPWALHLFAALADEGDQVAERYAVATLGVGEDQNRLRSLVLLDASEMYRLRRGE